MSLEDMLNKSILSKGAGKKNPIPKTMNGKLIRKSASADLQSSFERNTHTSNNNRINQDYAGLLGIGDDVEFDEDG